MRDAINTAHASKAARRARGTGKVRMLPQGRADHEPITLKRQGNPAAACCILYIMIAQRFGRLVVLARNGSDAAGSRWLCRCDCGAEKTCSKQNLRSGNTTSCGCLARELSAARTKARARHGMHLTVEHRTWLSMRGRCRNPRHHAYARYGGRGIAVCERWSVFENFYADMGPRPAGASLDRIDNDGPYSPENCRWATWIQQSNNRSTSIMIEAEGKTQAVGEWAREKGLSVYQLRRRIQKGWPAERALNTPIEYRTPRRPRA